MISRRNLIKLSSGILAAAPFIRMPNRVLAQEVAPLQPARKPFGRAIENHLVVREQPAVSAKAIRTLKWNDVIEVQGQVVAQSPTAHNPIWYLTTDGYVHSAYIQPCETALNPPLPTVPESGLWGEVSVPTTEGRIKPDAKAGVRERFYYGMVFVVRAREVDATGAVWYRITDGNSGTGSFVRAEHIRPLSIQDFTPLSPAVPLDHKRIEVDLKTQTATAYEDDTVVFTARVATGAKFKTPDGVRDFFTTPGTHRIFMKIPGQRMTGGTPGFDAYNLPGVSWVSYFTGSGIAFHGAYWHNDYGKPRSHGCVNMLPDDARWVFRWTMPAVDNTPRGLVRTAQRNEGSLVKVM